MSQKEGGGGVQMLTGLMKGKGGGWGNADNS